MRVSAPRKMCRVSAKAGSALWFVSQGRAPTRPLSWRAPHSRRQQAKTGGRNTHPASLLQERWAAMGTTQLDPDV